MELITSEQIDSKLYPDRLVKEYLHVASQCVRLKRNFFKIFIGVDIDELRNNYTVLAKEFENNGMYQYAALSYIGQAKCEHEPLVQCHSYTNAARAFLKYYTQHECSHLRTVKNDCRAAAMECYQHALSKIVNDSPIKAGIIREMNLLKPQMECVSGFASATHRIYDLQTNAILNIKDCINLKVLQQLDDIVDSIIERKMSSIYVELLRSVEVMRILLLIILNLTPVQQSPAHIKLIEYYYSLATGDELVGSVDELMDVKDASLDVQKNLKTKNIIKKSIAGTKEVMKEMNYDKFGACVISQQQYALAEIVYQWVNLRRETLKFLVHDFATEFQSITETERYLLNVIYIKLCEEI